MQILSMAWLGECTPSSLQQHVVKSGICSSSKVSWAWQQVPCSIFRYLPNRWWRCNNSSCTSLSCEHMKARALGRDMAGNRKLGDVIPSTGKTRVMVSCCWPTLSDNWFLVCDQLDKMPGDSSQVLQAAFLLDPEKGCSQAEGSSLNSFIWVPPLVDAPVPLTGTGCHDPLAGAPPWAFTCDQYSVLFCILNQCFWLRTHRYSISDPHRKGWHFHNKLDQEGNWKLQLNVLTKWSV